jgi:hypothetical protein
MYSWKSSGPTFTNTIADCLCMTGYKMVSGYCVEKSCTTDYQCPIGRKRKVGRLCYNDNDDCMW